MLDRYLALARDASSAGDPITAESFFQFAEHYYRIMHGDGFGGERYPLRARQTPGEDLMGDDETPPATPAEADGEPEAVRY